ncbi:hypothetical protein [Nonomuraea gerenzanensis]|uniref:Uncharacterized protein n=1 Tax=Nonomuraea gerenzanensis TaxID=93944 RepID=A0A1M4EDS0_9ACTN|nr:hypothetical protein [Nonomuraea gerenzanensis]UBU08753.1 hypothetical protein LCN96_30700 [Nonomuraea gerenzanensis]SBO97117.1 hypothetical protein BN4615_P6633 [Nonomuraea gerenzanensis]
MSFSFGQAIGPVAAGRLVALTGGYGVVWVLSPVAVLTAGVAVMRARTIR